MSEPPEGRGAQVKARILFSSGTGSAGSPGPGFSRAICPVSTASRASAGGVLRGGDRSTATGPAAGASPAASSGSPAGSPAAVWGAPAPGRRAPSDRPSPASVSGSAAAAPPPPGAAPAVRRLSKPPNVRAAPSSRPSEGTRYRSSVPSRISDPATHPPLTAGKSAGQLPIRRFGTPQPARPWQATQQPSERTLPTPAVSAPVAAIENLSVRRVRRIVQLAA